MSCSRPGKIEVELMCGVGAFDKDINGADLKRKLG